MTAILLISSLLLSEPPLPTDQEFRAAVEALPAHTLQMCGEEQCACFTIVPFKELLLQSHHRLSLLKELQITHMKLVEHGNLLQATREQVGALHRAMGLYKDNYNKMFDNWKEENRLRRLAEVKANSPWPVVTTVLGAAIGIGGGIWGFIDSDNGGAWALTGAGVVTMSVGILDIFL